jgi:hypothetical protein
MSYHIIICIADRYIDIEYWLIRQIYNKPNDIKLFMHFVESGEPARVVPSQACCLCCLLFNLKRAFFFFFPILNYW